MAGLQFEHNLPHQTQAVDAVCAVLDGIACPPAPQAEQNPRVLFEEHYQQLSGNISSIHRENHITQPRKISSNPKELIFDISMETGTGKTYTYTKTMFELNRRHGLFKFIVVVPRVAIKAGTVSFLRSAGAIEHFQRDYHKTIEVYEVASQSNKKSKKKRMPQAIVDFCRADRHDTDRIHVLVINTGMVNSSTISETFDNTLFDRFNVPYQALAHTQAVMIIDEPHLFKTDNKTFQNLRRFAPQFTLRYGATFDGQYENLLYQLGAVDAFNQDLVKGVVAHIEQFKEGQNSSVRLIDLDGKQASFELTENGKKIKHQLQKNDSFAQIHPEMRGLMLSNLNKSKVELSNGLELKKGDKLNPYSYADTLQNQMMQRAIVRHFEIERRLLTQSPRIKPLSLFFIDDIKSYREQDGTMRQFFEATLTAHLTQLVEKETDARYRQYLQTALNNVSALHGGYFSADNASTDEAIEQETLEILHDKEKLLSLDNPRRFIFSKWTLREGWDNPNIFQICKLRSSGSETSKLQEVGRGLRLPVNEYMARVKDGQHDLHYYVDFTEADFVETLTREINQANGNQVSPDRLEPDLISKILRIYATEYSDEEALLEFLDEQGVIKRNNDYKPQGFAKIQQLLPNAFGQTVKQGKVRHANAQKSHIALRQGHYAELKPLWEAISQKVVLEYQMQDDAQFGQLFAQYLTEQRGQFVQTGSMSVTQRLKVEQRQASFQTIQSLDEPVLPIKMMEYQPFLQMLSVAVHLNIQMLHQILLNLNQQQQFDIRAYMSLPTINRIKKGFQDFLMQQVFARYQISYCKTSNQIHPTKLTLADGSPRVEIDASDVGVQHQDGTPPDNYLFDQLFYDSPFELENIQTQITEVVVYSKIPKNSVRIPLVGGHSYSPDFAYVVKTKDGQTCLNLVVETKDKTENDLAVNESQRIKHAEHFFAQVAGQAIKIQFRKQLSNQKMLQVIGQALANPMP